MRFLGWVIAVPLAVIAIVFAVHNHEVLTLDLWPLPFAFTVPLFALVLGAVLFGLLLGWLLEWMAAGKWRRLARQRGREAVALQATVTELRAELARTTREAGRASGSESGPPAQPLALPPASNGRPVPAHRP